MTQVSIPCHSDTRAQRATTATPASRTLLSATFDFAYNSNAQRSVLSPENRLPHDAPSLIPASSRHRTTILPTHLHDKARRMTSRLKLSTATTSILSGAILTAVLLFTVLPRLHAEDIDRCQRRVAHAEHELHEAIEKHGRNSKKANHERRELHEARERCWREQHRWWDEHEHRWHTDRDWNEHDHD